MRIAVTGGRGFTNAWLLCERLDEYRKGCTAVIQGGHRAGADKLARDWAYSRGIQTITYDFLGGHGASGGPRRNRFMMEDAGADLLVAFPGGRGTKSCIKEAQRFGINVVVVADGTA